MVSLNARDISMLSTTVGSTMEVFPHSIDVNMMVNPIDAFVMLPLELARKLLQLLQQYNLFFIERTNSSDGQFFLFHKNFTNRMHESRCARRLKIHISLLHSRWVDKCEWSNEIFFKILNGQSLSISKLPSILFAQ